MGYGSVQVPVSAGVGESIVLLPAGLLAGLLPVYLKGSVLALSVTFGDTLPLLSLRDIFPRRGGSPSSKGEALAIHAKLHLFAKGSPFGRAGA